VTHVIICPPWGVADFVEVRSGEERGALMTCTLAHWIRRNEHSHAAKELKQVLQSAAETGHRPHIVWSWWVDSKVDAPDAVVDSAELEIRVEALGDMVGIHVGAPPVVTHHEYKETNDHHKETEYVDMDVNVTDTETMLMSLTETSGKPQIVEEVGRSMQVEAPVGDDTGYYDIEKLPSKDEYVGNKSRRRSITFGDQEGNLEGARPSLEACVSERVTERQKETPPVDHSEPQTIGAGDSGGASAGATAGVRTDADADDGVGNAGTVSSMDWSGSKGALGGQVSDGTDTLGVEAGGAKDALADNGKKPQKITTMDDLFASFLG